MNKQQLKQEIENLAKEENVSFLTAASHIKGAAAKLGNESIIEAVHELKMESLR